MKKCGNITSERKQIQPRLRALVEIVGDELKIFPIAESDREAEEILAGLLAWKGANGQ
jgi:hypothetical protein